MSRVAAFADQYRWSPPPIFSIGLSLLLFLVFIHQTVKQSVDGGVVLTYPGNHTKHIFFAHYFLFYPVCSPLAVHPLYTQQPWRLLTYSLTHYG